jgi:hypothetical protein
MACAVADAFVSWGYIFPSSIVRALNRVRAASNRYSEDAVDLCDILSSFAPHTKASLNELSKIMGLPGKPEGMDGNEVERYFLEAR